MRPSAFKKGGVNYWTIFTFDPDAKGVLKDADSTPTVAVIKNGAAVGDSVTVTKRSATTGVYDCSHDPASEVEGDVFRYEESATITGTTTAQANYDFGWDCKVDEALGEGVDGLSLIEGMRVVLAAVAGKVSGVDSNAPVFRDITDAKNRITATTDSTGRLTVTIDAS